MTKPVFAIKTSSGWVRDIQYRISFEPLNRRVRGVLGDTTVVDSLDAALMLEQGHVPVYYFPKSDVRMDLLSPATHTSHCPHKGDARYWSLNAGAGLIDHAAWAYPQPLPHLALIADKIAFYWHAMERWFEEDREVFVHPWDPRKRIDVVESSRPVEVMVNGEVVARSRRARWLHETDLPVRFYLPPEDVRTEVLTPSDKRTRCPYKGEAVYWTARVGGREIADLVWSYPEPVEECPRIKGLLCFFNELVDDITVDGKSTAGKWGHV